MTLNLKTIILHLILIFVLEWIEVPGQQLIQGYLIADQANDVRRILTYYPPEIILKTENSRVNTGSEEIRKLAEWDAGCDTLQFICGDSKVWGRFYPSNKKHSPTLIFTQGFMDTGDIWGIGKRLSENGINVFMFDFRGCFKSEGKQGLMNSQEDLEASLSFLRSKKMVQHYELDTAKIVLGGYSYGGHMSMLYAIHHSDIKWVASLSGGDLGIFGKLALSDSYLRKEYSNFFQSIRKPEGLVDFEFEDPIEELIENLEYFQILEQAEKLKDTDIFMTGGLDDSQVTLEEYILPLYRKITRNTGQKIQCRIYPCGHSYNNVSSQLIQDLSEWIKKIP